MKDRITPHTSHIPVMGTGYTIDTPLKVAHFGITSVVSIIDHRLIEQIREYHSGKNNIQFTPIPEDEQDCRAKRTTAYLDLLDELVKRNTENLRKEAFEPGTGITKYFEMLPESSELKAEYNEMLHAENQKKQKLQELLRTKIIPGEIQVNIMTKLDKVNYSKEGEALPSEYNDAHAALRGFAHSKLHSSLVLSAGLNPRLYGYMAGFDDFFPDSGGSLKKKIILKVSDYRSAIIQGKFLAKKGLWISEYRIESGLNCGGHAFATDGHLLGPILSEFKENRTQLTDSLFEVLSASLTNAKKALPVEAPALKISVQGGVGTHEEHEFLMDQYNVDFVGWGSPFLLVPEVVNVEDETLDLLARTGEEGFYLSNVSPLGVPFNAVKGSSGEIEKQDKIEAGKPGASCLKGHLVFNKEFTEKPICMASRQYQKQKIEELRNEKLSLRDFERSMKKITEKECLCVGLGNSLLLKNKIKLYKGMSGVTICPGPNTAYFSKISSLKEMMDHIYGRTNILQRKDRPHMFVKELKIYVDYLKDKLDDYTGQLSESQIKYYITFRENLNEGIKYYKNLFSKIKTKFEEISGSTLNELITLQNELETISDEKLPVHVYQKV